MHQVELGCDDNWRDLRWTRSFVHLIPEVVTYAAIDKATVMLLYNHIPAPELTKDIRSPSLGSLPILMQNKETVDHSLFSMTTGFDQLSWCAPVIDHEVSSTCIVWPAQLFLLKFS